MKTTYLSISTLNNSRYRFDSREWAWTFGDTILSVFAEDRKVTHFFPFAALECATVTHE
ncbi:hypothetical protein AWB76_07176 [Caballeronia temeraria]|uniref:Uncharacterized protein n=1 Tax=Caballeronia temeraria TaxID=1777137 RepID=A0A158DMM5_9BURK|nr:hypothetical protein [Caballeronia temeraria]SAK95680.1 hypothetical protein AWB76_07176 [Caballeronia temeraria]